MSDPDHVNEAIVRAARRLLIAGSAVDLGKVASEVGVDRTTIFRRIGRRDQLVAEALWSMTVSNAWPKCLAAHPPGTPHRAAEVLTSYMRLLIAEPWFRQFLHRDPQAALRILTTRATPIQARFRSLLTDLLAGEPEPPVDIDLDTLAQVVVRISESFTYADLITGATPDADTARAVFIALLG